MAETNRYAQGKIYRLVNTVDGEEYVGSTCTSLAKRLYTHKQDARRRPMPVHRHLNDIGWGSVSIVLIEEYPCENKMQLERRERHWIDMLKPTLNKNIPTRTKQEWRKDNPEAYAREREGAAKHREQNREALNIVARERNAKKRAEDPEAENAKMREWRSNNRETYNEYARNRQTIYREQHRDEYNAYNREKLAKYREANRDKVNAYQREWRAKKKAVREAQESSQHP